MKTGFDIRFNPEDGDPVATGVEYVGGADSVLDMLEGARALLIRAADFVNTDDGYLVEQRACALAYEVATGAADMMAQSGDPVSIDADVVQPTYRQHVVAHLMRLLHDNPVPAWDGPPED